MPTQRTSTVVPIPRQKGVEADPERKCTGGAGLCVAGKWRKKWTEKKSRKCDGRIRTLLYLPDGKFFKTTLINTTPEEEEEEVEAGFASKMQGDLGIQKIFDSERQGTQCETQYQQ
ncbi:hypothetical protein Fmac_008277 [Flemingia macrophylla]|uniref:Uncharacterized protein n=1 Tax=Flemingia macrophylla TaxID=520843 RepID=A0ABD1MXU1_9FABA